MHEKRVKIQKVGLVNLNMQNGTHRNFPKKSCTHTHTHFKQNYTLSDTCYLVKSEALSQTLDTTNFRQANTRHNWYER